MKQVTTRAQQELDSLIRAKRIFKLPATRSIIEATAHVAIPELDIKAGEKFYAVKSDSYEGYYYIVHFSVCPTEWTCGCKAVKPCKHIKAVNALVIATPAAPVAEPAKPYNAFAAVLSSIEELAAKSSDGQVLLSDVQAQVRQNPDMFFNAIDRLRLNKQITQIGDRVVVGFRAETPRQKKEIVPLVGCNLNMQPVPELGGVWVPMR